MTRRKIATILLFCFTFSALGGCSNVVQPDRDGDKRASMAGSAGQISPRPHLKDTIFFNWDEDVVAARTLDAFPDVVDWRVKMATRLDFKDYVDGNTHLWHVDTTIWGYDVDGNEIAGGKVVIDWNNYRRSGSTVSVSGIDLNMEQAGRLIEAIVLDAQDAGSGKALKAPCWWLATKAALEVGLLVVATGVAAAACAASGPGLAACVAALLAQGAVGLDMLANTLEFLCQCIDGYRELNPELCDGW